MRAPPPRKEPGPAEPGTPPSSLLTIERVRHAVHRAAGEREEVGGRDLLDERVDGVDLAVLPLLEADDVVPEPVRRPHPARHLAGPAGAPARVDRGRGGEDVALDEDQVVLDLAQHPPRTLRR